MQGLIYHGTLTDGEGSLACFVNRSIWLEFSKPTELNKLVQGGQLAPEPQPFSKGSLDLNARQK